MSTGLLLIPSYISPNSRTMATISLWNQDQSDRYDGSLELKRETTANVPIPTSKTGTSFQVFSSFHLECLESYPVNLDQVRSHKPWGYYAKSHCGLGGIIPAFILYLTTDKANHYLNDLS